MRTWKSLTNKERRAWGKFAKKHQTFLQRYSLLVEYGCFWCRRKRKRVKVKSWEQIAFHVHSTHGLPLDLMLTMEIPNET